VSTVIDARERFGAKPGKARKRKSVVDDLPDEALTGDWLSNAVWRETLSGEERGALAWFMAERDTFNGHVFPEHGFVCEADMNRALEAGNKIDFALYRIAHMRASGDLTTELRRGTDRYAELNRGLAVTP
jgi:hypothetical protein